MNRKGFTLVEIMIVVAIIALLAAIAIPNLLRARVNANESAALATVKTYLTALQSYAGANPNLGYPANINVLATATPPYVETALAGANVNNQRQGYFYNYYRTTVSGGVGTQFYVTGRPLTLNVTGNRSFYGDESGVVCFIAGQIAAPGHAAAGTSCPGGWTALTQ